MESEQIAHYVQQKKFTMEYLFHTKKQITHVNYTYKSRRQLY